MPEAGGDVMALRPPPPSQLLPPPALAPTWNARRHLKLNLSACHHTGGFYSTPALTSTGPSPCCPPRPDHLCVGVSAEEAHVTSKKSKLDYTNNTLPFSTPASALPGNPNHMNMCHNHHSHNLIMQQPPSLIPLRQHNNHHLKNGNRNSNILPAVSPTTAFISNVLGAASPHSPLPSPVVNNCGCGIVCHTTPTHPTRQKSAKLKPISPEELAAHMDKTRPLLLIDVRPAHSYHQGHIQGAVNLCTADRFTRRRIQAGKSSVFDIIGPGNTSSTSSLTSQPSPSSKRKASSSPRPLDLGLDIVVYDETSSLTELTEGVAWTVADSALCTVLLALLREGRDVHVLEGGLKSFVLDHEALTRSSFFTFDPSRPMLYSPTNGVQEPEIETATATQVLPFLYLGNERDAKDLSRLRSLDIRYVLNVTSHVPQYFEPHGIRYKRIPASDSSQQNLRQYFEEAIEYIDLALQQESRVLIHCHAGVSRSATVTIAYLLKHTRMAMADAYKFVKGKRSIISPNFNFMGQLLEFEQDLNDGVTPRILQPRLQGIESSV